MVADEDELQKAEEVGPKAFGMLASPSSARRNSIGDAPPRWRCT